MRSLAIFDLDDTLIAGDSDTLWGDYLSESELAGPDHQAKSDAFDEDYRNGRLDIHAYLEFQLGTLTLCPPIQLDAKRHHWLHSKILPIILPDALRLVNTHRAQGHELMIITSTNSFLAAPIAEYFCIDKLIATEPERRGGRYTGKVDGEPAFADGKVNRLRQWLEQRQRRFPEASWFYSDSHTDLPLLREVHNPVAVDPDQKLRSEAEQRNWPIISLRAARGDAPPPGE